MRQVSAVLAMAALAAGCTSTRHFAATGPAATPARPLSILVMRPDVEVGALNMGGVPQSDADWTGAARAALADALAAHARAHGGRAVLLPEQQGEAARLVGDYEHLHRAVSLAIAQFKYGTVTLPTKKKRFDWTLGPEAGRLATLTPEGASHALFLVTRDYFATDARKAMQVAGVLGCVVGFCVLPSGGQHFGYASLVDLQTGDVVWFNVMDGSAGDVRTPDGARSMVDRLLKTMPQPEAAAR